MSYQVLARKYRPRNFDQVVGQEHVLRVLVNAITQNRLHHAYLFAGTRGVGKTTIARILTKCLNCETGITATPCCKCDACLEIDSGKFIDLIEVDAASRTKVEDTRDLLDNVQYLPARGRLKVYIIDEVHMLSGHSFNALLKTLEEPPGHVKFLLATTDPQKLPVTVLSRCLQFNLKALSPEFIQKQLQYILTQEKIEYENSALNQLALAACGSVRDALSLLDQAIAFGCGKIITADINEMLGTIDTNKIFALLEALLNNNAKEILKIVSQLSELAVDFTNALNYLLEIFQKITIIQLVADVNSTNWPNKKSIQELAAKFNPEEIQLYYQIGLIGKRDLMLAPSERLGFEMVMLRMLAFVTKNDKKEQKSSQNSPLPTVGNNLNPNILQNLNVTGPTKALLRHCIIKNINENEVEILLDPNQAPLLNKNHETRINQALSDYFKRPIKSNITLSDININTEAKLTKIEATKRQDQAFQAIEKDSGIKELIDKFGAKIISHPVKI